MTGIQRFTVNAFCDWDAPLAPLPEGEGREAYPHLDFNKADGAVLQQLENWRLENPTATIISANFGHNKSHEVHSANYSFIHVLYFKNE